jgi:hypothetical protein
MSSRHAASRRTGAGSRYNSHTELDAVFARIARGMRVDTVALREAVCEFVDAHHCTERDTEQLLLALNESAVRSGLLVAPGLPGGRVDGDRAALIVQEAVSLCVERLEDSRLGAA